MPVGRLPGLHVDVEQDFRVVAHEADRHNQESPGTAPIAAPGDS